ncbi:SusC/RagA family TonB-linked outer membrane protein [Dyadobacter fermentans]|uniref:TonB-dependent receptor plug n=1 Tax=Dyadobacter fermentans (strain ATCC 700827 / DSM 18053 / CIP 107007 / KCTC 52180 / NS114) TaxID=471854 RepID=C6W4U4_DYAFD|nr:SusC/RagA family TonB-linked outer membrane protein [Dyadobacter fermentans]ACT95918.1 TonB-dependent receptor plug [Dyadobacter fermentans DSM 18053]
MNLTLSAKQWVAIGIVLMTQSSRVVHSQVIAFASVPSRQHMSIGQEMKLKNVLLDLQRHYGVEIIFEDRLVGSVNVASSNLDFNQPIEKNLDQLLRQNGLKYKKTRKNTFVITEGKGKEALPGKDNREEALALPEQALNQENLTAQASAGQEAVDRTIKGNVTDEGGAGLPGVSVVLKGTQRGTSTGASGEFSLEIPDGGQPVLVFSFVGYKSQEVTVGNQSAVNVTMAPDENALEEVVVVGYGTVKKSDLTGAVGTLKAEVLQERPASSLNQGLSGRITGVNVSSNSGRPGGRANIRIRGASSISVSNNPLYVIDGVILNAVDLQNGSTPIDYLNPNDIASIEVLKDASSTAIYGARGANGVILVTTKRGTSGGGKVTYDTDFSIGVAPRKLPVLNSREFLQVEETLYANAAKYDPVGWATGTKYTDPKLKRTNPLLFDSNGNPLYDTDWQKEAFQKAFTQNHQLGFTGGNEKGSFGAFLNYRNEDGIIKESWQKRFSGRLVFDSQIKSWLKVGGTLGYTDQNEKQIDQLGGGGITAMRQVLEALPIIPVKYPDGRWASNRDYPGMEGGDSPLRVVNERLFYLKTQTMLGNMYANIRLADGLELRSTVGANVINQRNDYFAAAGLQYITSNGEAWVINNRYNSWQFENYLTYYKDFGKIHSINAMVGLSWQHVDRFDNQARAQNFTDTYFQYNNLSAGAIAIAPTSRAEAYGLNSYFARINYSLMNKYLVTFTGRMDGSSKFGDANRYAFFPSAAVAWRVNEEEFLKNSNSISNLKIRASYGATGNSEIPAYRALAGMASSDVIFGGTRNIGIGVGRMSNANLQWEKTQQVDLGIELGLFQNRVSFELDLYRRKVNEMLLDAPLPSSSGYTSIFTNIGSMENKGVEFAVNSTNIKAGDFSWNTTFNISVNKNKVLALSGGSDIFSGATVIRVGEPVGSFFGRVHQGIWSTSEAEEAKKYNMLPGDVKYADLNKDGAINDNDRAIIGKGIPDGFGTFLNTFSYKQWSLTVDLQYMYGNDVLDRSIHSAEDRQGIANSYKTVLNAWTETNQNTPIAQVRPINAYYTTNNDSHKVTDASFIRGRNLLLAYVFPTNVVSKLKLDRLRAYASIQNFFVATKYKGYDPEVSNSSSPFDQGLGLYDYPKPRVFMLGLNIGL